VLIAVSDKSTQNNIHRANFAIHFFEIMAGYIHRFVAILKMIMIITDFVDPLVLLINLRTE